MLDVWRMSHGKYTGGGRAETLWKATSAKEVGSAIELVSLSVVLEYMQWWKLLVVSLRGWRWKFT